MKNKLVKASIGYTIANILIKGINFITLPIFTRLLSTSEYGLYSVFAAYESILSCICGFALHASIKKANQDLKGKIDEYVSSIIVLVLANGAFLSILSILFRELIYSLTGFNWIVILNLILLSMSSNIITIYNMRLSLNYSYFKYMLCAVFNSLGSVALSIILICSVYDNDRFMGKIIGQTMIAAVIAVVLVAVFIRRSRPHNLRTNLEYGLKFSMPLIPHGISQIILAQCDRLMIKAYRSSADAGIYSFAGNLNTILIVISDSVGTVWSTWFFENADEGNYKGIQQRAGFFVIIFFMLTVGLMAVSPEMIMILGSRNYWISKYVCIPLIASGFLVFCYNIIVQGEYYTNRTKYVLLGTIIAAVINIFGNFIFINKFGYIAAAYTTLFSYLCYIVLHFNISKKLLGYEIVSFRTLLLSICSVFVWGTICLYFINAWIIRWICIFILELLLLLLLIKKKGTVK